MATSRRSRRSKNSPAMDKTMPSNRCRDASAAKALADDSRNDRGEMRFCAAIFGIRRRSIFVSRSQMCHLLRR